MSTSSESIRDRIGSVTQRLVNRVGRAFGTCQSCGRPTRSHVVGSGVQCHRCYVADEPVPVTDGGTSDRHSRDERELFALLSGENPDDVTLDPREDRQVVPAGYAADGVCGGRCPTDADDAPDAFIDAAVAAVREWQSRNEPLKKRAVDDLRSRFAREPGEPAVRDNSHGSRCVHLREVEATELGVWVADADVALVDLDDDVRFADLHAVPVGDDDEEDKYVPLVVAADGFFGEVATAFHEHYHALQRVRDRLDAAGPILTDGGSGDDSNSLTRSQWDTLLTSADGRTHGDLVAALQEDEDVSVADPDQYVDDAIASGTLEKDPDAGMFPHIYLSDPPEPAEPADTGDSDPEDTDSDSTNPGSEPGESDTDEDISKYRRVYLDAADRADREPWEYVEEDAIRAALANIGFAELLDNGTLFDIHEWKYIDVSDDGEDPRRRWYCPSGNEPRPAEFRRFHTLLTETAPDGYEPHYFRVRAASKAPATRFGGWKETDARLSVDEAVEWMEQGGNVGIAGRGGCRECGGNGIQNDEPCSSCDGTGENPDHDGPLVNVDIDDDEETTPDDVPSSLRARSRSRTGWHTWYFDHDGEIPNIPTDDYGEIRTNWQYVVAPGSFVASTSEEIPDDAADAGYYTIADEASVASIDYDELPEVFREVAESDPEPEPEHDHEHTHEPRDRSSEDFGGDGFDGDGDGDRSAVFDIEAVDLVPGSKDPSERFTSIFHGSETGANMAVSNDKVHCWRHGVAHGGLQALCVLSDVDQVSTYGCRELGKEHTNSNAGVNALRGNWRLVWGAWHYAKKNNHIPTDDPVPYRVLRELAVDDGIVAREDLVVRDTDSGGVVDDPDAHEGDTYTALPSGTYNEVLQHIEDTYDVDSGRDPISGTGGDDGDGDPEEHRSDPTDLTATVSVKRAWDAAGRVSPGDLTDHDLPVNDDAGSFACPYCGEPVDVVRAVAIDTGLVDSCEESLDETYPTAYDRARSLGAPLPEYYTERDAIARFDALLDVIGEVTFWDLANDALDSEVTGTDDDVSGDAVRTLNPSWRESDSEASVLVFPSGTIWDADTERVLDAVRFAAVDSGLIEDPTAPVEGALFTEAYRRCRNHYDAPLPHWNPGGDRTVTPDLPDGRDLIDTRDVDGVNVDRLEDARKRVERVVGDLVSVGEGGDSIPTVVTSPPATGKTTATVKSARDGPNAYTTPRKELQQQAVDKADRWGVDSYILPVFSEESVRSGIIEEAVAHVRANSKDCLRDRWALINAAVGAVDCEDNIDACDIFEEDDEEEESVDLDRATCPTADGDHGVAWALAVHVAHRLGYRPGEIHGRAKGLFGAELPCCEDGSCEYGNAWEDVRDPDNCPDLLVGSHTHAHLESVRTYYERDSSGGVDRSPRTVVVDEFPGDAFTNDLGPEAFDFATWLARSLRGDIDDRRDMFDADLYSDDWVRAWLEGAIGEDSDSDSDDPIVAEVERVIHALARVGELLDARDSAADMVSEYGGALEELGVRSTLTEFVDGTAPEDEVYRALEDLTEESVDENLRNIFDWIIRDVHDPLARATDSGTEPADAGIHTAADTDLPIGGDLASLLEDAVDAARTRGDAARERIRAAVESLRGGPDGCRQLAAWADDGYAHPDAHHILTGIITPTGDDSDVADTEATRINTSSWAFDPSADEGSVMDVVSTAGNATTIVDRNDHGARLHTPPSRVAGNGEKAPLVGLDATGRAILWRVVLGEEVQTTDIFDSDRERRQFLEDTLDLRVIQAADDPRFYEGDPATKDTDGDAALLQAIAEEYSGIQAPRQRGEEPQEFGKPAAITTKRIREVLESDPRLDGVVDTWDNYGNVTGKNELGDHRLAAILGCQHFGDDAIEQFAALAGEEVDTDHLTGRGADLDYDSDVANAYLKHMSEDKTMQAILRFARGEDGGATVVARTSALRDDLPVVGRGDVVETWSDTATNIVEKARSLGREFTSADVRPAVDVKSRQVRRVLGELVDAGYLAREDGGAGRAHEYEQVGDPGAGEVSIPNRDEAVPDTETPGRSSSNTYYTANVRVFDPNRPREDDSTPPPGTCTRAPPAPSTIEGVGPPG